MAPPYGSFCSMSFNLSAPCRRSASLKRNSSSDGPASITPDWKRYVCRKRLSRFTAARRGREGGVVELEREVLGAGVLGRLAPARAELDAVGGDPVVGAALAVLGDRLDGRLDVDVESADRAGEAAVVAAGEGADL